MSSNNEYNALMVVIKKKGALWDQWGGGYGLHESMRCGEGENGLHTVSDERENGLHEISGEEVGSIRAVGRGILWAWWNQWEEENGLHETWD